MGTRENNGENGSSILIGGGIAALFVIGCLVSAYFLLIDQDDPGKFGDMFGGVNALFSGLAFAGIIVTILLQRNELGLQRDELRETRKEFKTQNETLKIQRFENTFFNLLSLHNQIVQDIDYEVVPWTGLPNFHGKKVTYRGRDVFQVRFEELDRMMDRDDEHNEVFLEFYDGAKNDLGHYFRNLYRIIKMVHETVFFSESPDSTDTKQEIAKKNHLERYKYISIIRAQLSDYELLLLFFNCLSDYGAKFKPLAEEYALFDNVPHHEALSSAHWADYAESASDHEQKLQSFTQ